MYSILKILLVLKLTLILLILTAGMWIVSEHSRPTDSTDSEIYRLMELSSAEQMIIENGADISHETNLSETVSDHNCSHKSSLGELRLYIEL